MAIQNLSGHPARYLTVGELAEYWGVSRQQIYKRIESGALLAIRLGERIYRVPIESAIEYERKSAVINAGQDSRERSRPAPATTPANGKQDGNTRLHRVRTVFR